MSEIRPLGALLRGMLAGAGGAAVQSQFFKATARITPTPPPGVFEPPEPKQAEEMSTATVARRWVEGLMQRGPLTDAQKQKGATLVHFAFGAAWGGLYGLSRESFRSIGTPLGTAAFSTVVWYASDNVILPAFRLSAWPRAYPAKSHAYAWLAHLVYGAGLWSTYTATRQNLAALALGVWAARANLRAKRKVRAARLAGAKAAVTWLGDHAVFPIARTAAVAAARA